MSILTGSELEFLGSLNVNWSRLYHNELARLVKEACNRGDDRRRSNVPEAGIELLEQRQ